MFKYLYKRQVPKFVILIFLSIISCLFEVGLAYVMLRCVDFAMAGDLSDAGVYAVAFILYIAVYFIIDIFAKRAKWQKIALARRQICAKRSQIESYQCRPRTSTKRIQAAGSPP